MDDNRWSLAEVWTHLFGCFGGRKKIWGLQGSLMIKVMIKNLDSR